VDGCRCSEGKIRSGFRMTEPGVLQRTRTNIEARIVRDGNDT